jgi:hypothetical protein
MSLARRNDDLEQESQDLFGTVQLLNGFPIYTTNLGPVSAFGDAEVRGFRNMHRRLIISGDSHSEPPLDLFDVESAALSCRVGAADEAVGQIVNVAHLTASPRQDTFMIYAPEALNRLHHARLPALPKSNSTSGSAPNAARNLKR